MSRLVLAAAAALVGFAASAQDSLEGGDPAAGEKAFRKCAACHTVGEGAANRVGPHLNDIFGRAPGAVEDFAYSPAMETLGETHVWDAALMAEFLRNPRGTVSGTKMAFAGIRSDEELADILAFLAQHDPQGLAAD